MKWKQPGPAFIHVLCACMCLRSTDALFAPGSRELMNYWANLKAEHADATQLQGLHFTLTNVWGESLLQPDHAVTQSHMPLLTLNLKSSIIKSNYVSGCIYWFVSFEVSVAGGWSKQKPLQFHTSTAIPTKYSAGQNELRQNNVINRILLSVLQWRGWGWGFFASGEQKQEASRT